MATVVIQVTGTVLGFKAKNTVIQTPATPKKAPTYGLIWPSGR